MRLTLLMRSYCGRLQKCLTALSVASSLGLAPVTEAPVFRCETTAGALKGAVTVTEMGRAWLELKAAGRTHRCRLILDEFEDQARAEEPFIEFRFTRVACGPALGAKLEHQVLRDIRVILKEISTAKPRARIYWLGDAQTAACKIDVYQREELKIDAGLWREGKWGRR